MSVTSPLGTKQFAVSYGCMNAVQKTSDLDQTCTADLYSRNAYLKHREKDLKSFTHSTSIFDKRLVLDTNINFASAF
jgi:hypothetical protein